MRLDDPAIDRMASDGRDALLLKALRLQIAFMRTKVPFWRERLATLVRYTAAAHVWASIALFHRLQISLIIPLALTEGERFVDPDPAAMGAPLLTGSDGPSFAIASAM